MHAHALCGPHRGAGRKCASPSPGRPAWNPTGVSSTCCRRFDAEQSPWCFPAELLRRPLPGADPILRKLMEDRIHELQLRADDDLLAQLRCLLRVNDHLAGLLAGRRGQAPSGCTGAPRNPVELAAQGTSFLPAARGNAATARSSCQLRWEKTRHAGLGGGSRRSSAIPVPAAFTAGLPAMVRARPRRVAGLARHRPRACPDTSRGAARPVRGPARVIIAAPTAQPPRPASTDGGDPAQPDS